MICPNLCSPFVFIQNYSAFLVWLHFSPLDRLISSIPLALRPHDQLGIIRDLIIERLPMPNYQILKFLIEFLHLVSTYSDVNQMTTTNLSLVFGSNLIWSDDPSMNNLANYALINSLTEILIARYTELFFK